MWRISSRNQREVCSCFLFLQIDQVNQFDLCGKTKETHNTKCLGVEEMESEWKFKKQSPYVARECCDVLHIVRCLAVVHTRFWQWCRAVTYILDLDRSRCVCSGLVGRECCLKLLAADFWKSAHLSTSSALNDIQGEMFSCILFSSILAGRGNKGKG